MKATTGDYLVQQEFPGTKRKEYKTGEDAAKALKKKRIDLFVCDAPTIWWLAGMHETDGLVAVPISLSQESLARGVRRSDAELLASVNRALEKLQQNGQVHQTIKHWIPLFK
jgi:ABC-type amino acid transport substrate-binding protein